MDSLLETIDEIKTLIPDAKYMELMTSLTKMHKKSKETEGLSMSHLKSLVVFLLEASENENTCSYIRSIDIDNELFYKIIVQCPSGFDCRDTHNNWLTLLETEHVKVPFQPFDYLPQASYANYALSEMPLSPNGTRRDERLVNIYFGFDSYNEDEFMGPHGEITMICVENANSMGKSCLVHMAKALITKYF